MSHENYIKSLEISEAPFEALIMGFMRIADDDNLHFLRSKYPEIWKELKERYDSPGGYLKGEKEEKEVLEDNWKYGAFEKKGRR